MFTVNGEPRTLFEVTCSIYDANMMLRTLAELDPFQRPADFPCWRRLTTRLIDWWCVS